MKMDTHINHPEGVEVKLSTKNLSIRFLVYSLGLFIVGSLLFTFIWDEFSAYSIGHQLGSIAKRTNSWQALVYIVPILVIYILFQAVILYWLGGKNLKALCWQCDMKAVGFSLRKPIALKYYRVALLLPGILVGVLPAIHGFCTGSTGVFYLGLFGIMSALGDFLFCHKLRAFDDEDLLLSNRESYQATIIKRNYRKGDR